MDTFKINQEINQKLRTTILDSGGSKNSVTGCGTSAVAVATLRM